MRSLKVLIPIIAVVGLVASPAGAACPLPNPADCIYVDDDCLDPPFGGTGTQADPYCTITDAYIAASFVTSPADPSTILVMPGNYAECVLASGFPFDAPVLLLADAWLENPLDPDDPGFEDVVDDTVIDGTGVCDGALGFFDATVLIGGTGAELRGFAITGAGASGVYALGSVAITNNLVWGNQATLGGGIYLYTAPCLYDGDTDAEISKNLVRDNFADDDFLEQGTGDGGGIYVWALTAEPDVDCTGGAASVSVEENVVTDNTTRNTFTNEFSNDFTSLGGGIYVLTDSPAPGALPAEDSAASVAVTRNVVSGNTITAGSDGFGAGIWASTYGRGNEKIEIRDNTIGPDNVSDSGGGGVSAWVQSLVVGNHEMVVEGNEITGNTSGLGGGLDAFMVLNDLTQGNSSSMLVFDNAIDANEATASGGGIHAELNSNRTIELDDVPTFPGHGSPADEVEFLIGANSVTNNLASAGGGGISVSPFADADPDGLDICIPGPPSQRPATARIDLEANFVANNMAQGFSTAGPGCSDAACETAVCNIDPFCCNTEWDEICAGEALGFPECIAVCDTSDCCEASGNEEMGAGILVRPISVGEALATVAITTTTVGGNSLPDSGFVGGIETSATTYYDCDETDAGLADVFVTNSVVYMNEADGVGGPEADPGLQIVVEKCSVFGNGDDDPSNDPDLDFEDTLWPDGPPAGNLPTDTDPLLDPVTLVPALCSDAHAIGVCSTEPLTICWEDSHCPVECSPEGAGYVASPDINGDDTVDGIDILNLAVAFSSSGAPFETPDPRFDTSVDLDRDGLAGPDDLALMSVEFGEVCPQD